jgi:Pyruvate/2-oxoacid:ferredoxin oxidoreductase gamma subunit
VIYNGETFPPDCEREDVHVLALPFSRLADDLGDARISNMVMLGALLEIAEVLPQSSVDAALRRLVKHSKWVELDERALARGRELFRESFAEV